MQGAGGSRPQRGSTSSTAAIRAMQPGAAKCIGGCCPLLTKCPPRPTTSTPRGGAKGHLVTEAMLRLCRNDSGPRRGGMSPRTIMKWCLLLCPPCKSCALSHGNPRNFVQNLFKLPQNSLKIHSHSRLQSCKKFGISVNAREMGGVRPWCIKGVGSIFLVGSSKIVFYNFWHIATL